MSETKAETGRRLRVTLVRSTIGFNESQAKVAQSLGLRKLNSSVEVKDHPATRGMIYKIRHLVRVEDI